MGKQWKPNKKTVELEAEPRPSRIRRDPAQVSRIRRDPAPVARSLPGFLGKIDWQSREMEITLAVTGIILFALALDALSIGISAIYK